MAFLLDSSRKQKQNICDASLFVQSENWIWSRVSRGYNQSLSQFTSIMTDRFIYSQELCLTKKKRIFSLFFFFELVKGMISEDKPNRFFLPPLCSILCGFFHQFFFFCRSRVYFFWCTVFLCNCYQNVCQTQPWFINLIIILPRERKTLMLITWLNEILECPFTDKCIFLQ